MGTVFKKTSGRTRNTYLSALLAFSNWCIDEGRLISNPFTRTPRLLVPRLRLGTHCLRGSASPDRILREAEPTGQAVPRRSLGTRLLRDLP
jgi:hypothetical protein